MKLKNSIMAGALAVLSATGLGLATAGDANAVPANNCGSSANAALVSHPVSLMADGHQLGQIYLGYFSDCKGVYAEIHWNYGPTTPIASSGDGQTPETDVYRPEGKLYVVDEKGNEVGIVHFRMDHLDGSYTTTGMWDIHTDPSGNQYAAPERFSPAVDLTVYRTKPDWSQKTLCAGKQLWGNYHDFYSGAWGSGRYGDCN